MLIKWSIRDINAKRLGFLIVFFFFRNLIDEHFVKLFLVIYVDQTQPSSQIVLIKYFTISFYMSIKQELFQVQDLSITQDKIAICYSLQC